MTDGKWWGDTTCKADDDQHVVSWCLSCSTTETIVDDDDTIFDGCYYQTHMSSYNMQRWLTQYNPCILLKQTMW